MPLIFRETPLKGAYIIDSKRFVDERGFFSEVFHQGEFEEKGILAGFVQTNLSHNKFKGTLRGLHSQKPPHAEVKLVRCVQGRIWDVMVDVRPDSQTYGDYYGIELSAENALAAYIPQGFLHGFLTLEDDSDVLYQVSAHYQPTAAHSARYDDPAFNIAWPFSPSVVSAQDQAWPPFKR
ncbi:MAG: dTDP-4-dehydrorhamnose 3,5-epimerase [Vampirovibrionales bacterium]|nr:dTDP-4-dehydrorhamnose 3,5-epimerase [Vampirovibrionales bacterium]